MPLNPAPWRPSLVDERTPAFYKLKSSALPSTFGTPSFDLLQTHGGHLLKLAWNLRFTFQRGEKALGPVFDIVM